jgi:hypothetical protein
MQITKSRIIKIGLLLAIFYSLWYYGRFSVYSKRTFSASGRLSNSSLYWELFYISPLDSESYSEYITDSLHFRKFVGVTGRKESYDITVKGNLITIDKWSSDVQYIFDTVPKTLEDARRFADSTYEYRGESGFGRYYKVSTKKYSLEYLKAEKAWD